MSKPGGPIRLHQPLVSHLSIKLSYYAHDLDGKRKYICNVTIKISKTHILLYILELFTCHT